MRMRPLGRLTALVLTLSLLLGMVPAALAEELLPPPPTEQTEGSAPPTEEIHPVEEPGGEEMPEEPAPADDIQAEPAAETDSIALPGGVTFTAGISGYIDTEPWLFTETKGLTLGVDDLSSVDEGNEYKVRITLAQGMRFSSYFWDDDKKVADIPKDVRGVPQGDSGISSLIKSNEITIDESGIVTLTYTILHTTQRINFTNKITVRPDEYYVYDGDRIDDAVTLALLDNNGVAVGTPWQTNVTVEDPYRTSILPLNISGLAANTKYTNYDKSGYTFYLTSYRSSTIYVKELTMTLPLPDVVTDVPAVKIGNSQPSQVKYDSKNHILTISYKNMPAPSSFGISLTLDISTRDPGTYQATQQPSIYWLAYDGGKVEAPISGLATIKAVETDAELKVNVNTDSYVGGNPVGPEGVLPLVTGIAFSTNAALTTPQHIGYDFTPESGLGLDIVRTEFPIQNADSLTDLKVTFDDGSRFERENVTKEKGSDLFVAVTMDSLRKEGYEGGGKYIRTIEANCGTFEANYSYSSTRTAVGRFSEGVVQAYIGSGRLNVPYRVTRNSDTNRYEVQYWNHKGSNLSIQTVLDKTNISAGDKISVKAATSVSAWTDTPTFYVVERDGFTLDPTSVKFYLVNSIWEDFAKDGAPISAEQTKVEFVTVQDKNGISYNAHQIYVPGLVVSLTTSSGKLETKNQLGITFDLIADEGMKTGQYSTKDIVLLTNGQLTQLSGISLYSDPYDLNNDDEYDDRIAAYDQSRTIEVTESPNLYLKQWMTEPNGNAETPAYNPGLDGSTNVNAVPFVPGASAELHIQLRNTNDTANGDSIRAYIPIPKAKVKSSTVTAQNIQDSNGGRDSRYQFNDYQWNMNLSALVQNPDTNLYNITYYTGTITTDASGEPQKFASKLQNPRAPSEIVGGLEAVSMVGITVIDGKSIPLKNGPLPYTAEFVVPLTVGTTENEANTADLNGTKNIIRPWFYRSSNAGAGYTGGNYAAPLLSAAVIEGVVFDDKNFNGLNDEKVPLNGVTVKLTSKDGTVNKTTTTDGDGKYKFGGLTPGDYTVTATNPKSTGINDADARHFAKNITTSSQYKVNSDGVAAADHKTATVSVTVPAPKGQPVDYNSYIDFGFVSPATVKFENTNTKGGSIPSDADQKIWPGSKVTPPTATPNSGYTFGRYSVGGTTVDLSTHIFDGPATVLVHWTALDQTLTLDANGGKYPQDMDTKTVKIPTDGTLKSYLDDPANHPTRAGYTFESWVDDKGAELTATIMPAGGLTVYAKWKASKVTLTFDPAGGEFDKPGSASMEVLANSTFTPPTVAKQGSTFQGWYTDLDDDSTKLPDNPTAPTVNTTYYAKWAGYNVSGRVFLDRNYNGVYTLGNTEDVGLSDVPVTLKKAGTGETVATTKTDANGSFILDAAAAGSYYLEVATTHTGPDANLIAKQIGGSSVNPATGRSDPFQVADGGVSGKNIGYAEPISFKLYSDAARKNEVTGSTTLKLQEGQTSFLYYTMSPSYLSSTAPRIVPTVGSTDHVSSAHASYGIISLSGSKFTDSTTPSSLTATVGDGFGTNVAISFQAQVLPPQVVAQFEDNLNFYTQVLYQKEELLGGITLQNQIYDRTDLMDENKGAKPFHPVAVYKLNADGNRGADLSGELAGDTKKFDDGYIGKYEMVFAGTDVYGRPVVDANGNSEIVRTVYIHGYPYLTKTAPIQSRLNAGYNPMMEQDGSTYITATHQHVYTKADGTIETRADETFSAAPAKLDISLLGYYPYDTGGGDHIGNGRFRPIDLTDPKEQAKLLTTTPTEPGAYEVFYTVRMGTRQAVLQLHRTLYLHGSPSMYVPTVISIAPEKDKDGPMDLDYAAEQVWRNTLLDMHDLVHVQENGSTVTYKRANTKFYNKSGIEITEEVTNQAVANAGTGSYVIAAPKQGIYGGVPANVFLHKDSMDVLKNTPDVYEVTVVFQDTIDGMGSTGTQGTWTENWGALFQEGGMGYTEMKVKVVVTSKNTPPVLPAQDQLITNFVLGDSVWFSQLTDFDDKTIAAIEKDGALGGQSVADELKKRIAVGTVIKLEYEGWIRYYQAEDKKVTETSRQSDPFNNKKSVSLLELLTQSIRYKTHDVDIHALKGKPGYDELHKAAVTLLWKSVKLTQVRVPILGTEKDEVLDAPSNDELLELLARNQPGTLEATFSVANVKIDSNDNETGAGTLASAANKDEVSGYKYKLTLDTNDTVTETYKIYIHSDILFERPNGAPLVTYGLHIPSSQSHTSMSLRAYFIGAKALQRVYGPAASSDPDISTAGDYINMDYVYTHPIQGILPTLREKTVHYYGRAFVNGDVGLYYQENPSLPSSRNYIAGTGGADIVTGFAAKVNKWTGLPADDALTGRNDKYPAVNGTPPDAGENIVATGGAKYETDQNANLKIYEGGTLLYDSAKPDEGSTLTGEAPGKRVLTYVAEDEGTDANHPYHNGPNRKSATVAYVFDGPVTLSFGPNVIQTPGSDGTTTYTIRALDTVTDDELAALLGANATVVYGDDAHLRPSGVEVKYHVVRDSDKKPTSVRVSAEARNGNKTEAVVLVTTLREPVIHISQVDQDGQKIGDGPFMIFDAVIGQPYTVFAPHVAGYVLDGDPTQIIPSVQAGDNHVSFQYKKVEPDANLAVYTITYQLNDMDKTQLMSGTWRELVGKTIEHKAPEHYYKDGQRYTLVLADNEKNPKSIKLTKDGPNALTFTYKADPEPVQVQYTVRYIFANADNSTENSTGVAETHSLVGNVGDTVTANAPASFSRDGYQYTLKDNASKTFKLTDTAANNVIDFTYSRTAISTGGGGGGGGGGGSTVKYYALTFEVNGGSAIQAVTEQSGKTIKLADYQPTRKGYTFTGWFSDSTLKKPLTEVKLDTNKVVYAGWEKSVEQPDTGVTGGTTVSDSLITDDHFAYVQGTEGRFEPTRNMTRAEAAMIFYRLLKDKQATATATFSDVPASEWYAQAVNTLAGLEVITGYTDGTFKPDGTISRAEFVTIATRFVGLTDENPSFTDVPSDYWAYHYIATAVTLGWVNGYPDGSFQPAKTITRAEAVKIVNRMLERKPDKAAIDKLGAPYSDLGKDNWAYYEILEASIAHEFEIDKQNKETWTKQK